MNFMDKLKMHTPDFTDENIARIAELFPNCVTESRDDKGKLTKAIDFDLLRQELSGNILEGPQERYHLDWPGKREALLTANAPIAKTLRPCREESVDFDTTKNLYIEGDNLDALKLLQETYLGKVKMIYIDPPYNTGNDFIYEDDFAEDKEAYFERSLQKDEEGNRLVANTDSNGRFHSDWLTMMLSRLKLARNLLTDDGVIFISIDDNEVENLKKIANEVFGEENFLNQISVKAKASSGASGGGEDKRLKKNIEYLLVYTKSSAFTAFTPIYKNANLIDYIETRRKDGKAFAYTSIMIREEDETHFDKIKAGNGDEITVKRVNNYEVKSVSRVMKDESLTERQVYDKYFDKIFTLENAQTSIRDRVLSSCGEKDEFFNCYYKPISGRNKGVMTKVGFMGATKRLISYLSNVAEKIDGELIKRDKVGTLWDDLSWSSVSFEGEVKYNNGKKPVALINRILEMYSSPDATILDFFSGSASTAHACFLHNSLQRLNAKFIMVQLPEDLDANLQKASSKKVKDEIRELINFLDELKKPHLVSELGKERIRRAGKKIKAEAGLMGANLDIGFRVLKVDTSNMKDVYYSPDTADQRSLLDQVTNIKEDRTPEDLLFQVLLDWGVDLTLPIAKETIAGKTTFFVDTNALAACFDEGISTELVKEIAKQKPMRAVFRDTGYDRDDTKINVAEVFKLISPDTEVKAI